MMTDEDFLVWCIKDAAREMGKGMAIYAVLLSAYWLIIG